ncbi:DUF2953 domain-containing protein [Bacillus shivajii]|uniref:DUF2953 domain-containing protein n=1 Tax=Bacillus shivajii TaxID=1983719 RepID=UPI001CFB2D5D|nr:DUF2953 domain-containing protein [Bacillus shivajii]UCZ52285.1 DUF2953 domain-containing protein [Bacillus shivajii]
MKWILIILLVIIIFMFILAILKLTLYVSYSHNGQDDEGLIQFRLLFGFIRYTVKIPLLAIDKESPSLVIEEETGIGSDVEKKRKFNVFEFIYDLEQFERFLTHVFGFHTIVRNFMAKIHVNKLSWYTEIGTGDAALTGSISGVVWGIKGNVVGFAAHLFQLNVSPSIDVVPKFQEMELATKFECMVSFRIGHAILAGLKVIRHWQKGKPFLQNPVRNARRDMNV